jgi:ATP-dependent Lon protease
VIIPRANLKDVEELPEEVRTTIRFHAVRTMDEVLGIALRAHAGRAALVDTRVGAVPH